MNEQVLSFRRSGDELHFEVVGMVEEAFTFKFDLNGIRRVQIDLGKMKQMNSIGCKNWISWLSKFPADIEVVLVRCPTFFLELATMFINIIPQHVRALSFYVPFVCDHCLEERVDLFTEGLEFQRGEIPQLKKIPCPKCSSFLSLDADDKSFFGFME